MMIALLSHPYLCRDNVLGLPVFGHLVGFGIRDSCRASGTDATPHGYLKLHGSCEKAKPKPADKAICYAIRELGRGREPGMTRRRIQMLRAECLRNEELRA